MRARGSIAFLGFSFCCIFCRFGSRGLSIPEKMWCPKWKPRDGLVVVRGGHGLDTTRHLFDQPDHLTPAHQTRGRKGVCTVAPWISERRSLRSVYGPLRTNFWVSWFSLEPLLWLLCDLGVCISTLDHPLCLYHHRPGDVIPETQVPRRTRYDLLLIDILRSMCMYVYSVLHLMLTESTIL